MAMNSEYRGSASNVAAPKKKAATKTKTVATPGTKVSQATIDKIKAMGMTKALKGAANASPEMREGLKRLYGAKRVAAAGGSSARYSSPDAARAGASSSGVKYKSADAARAAATAPKKSTTRIPSAAGFGAQTMPNKPGSQGKKVNMPNTPGTVGKVVTMPYKKPTAAQIAAGKARAGGNSSVYSSSRTAPAKTQAQINAAKRAADARKKAAAAARKAAGGRNI